MSNVLIVDDESDSREAMSGYLQKFGYSVRCAHNGQEAIAALGQGVPDAIILDWMMPKMDGITFLQIIRSYLNWSNVPVILVSAYDGPHIQQAKALGVNSVFMKGSFELSELLECVKRKGRARVN